MPLSIIHKFIHTTHLLLTGVEHFCTKIRKIGTFYVESKPTATVYASIAIQ